MLAKGGRGRGSIIGKACFRLAEVDSNTHAHAPRSSRGTEERVCGGGYGEIAGGRERDSKRMRVKETLRRRPRSSDRAGLLAEPSDASGSSST